MPNARVAKFSPNSIVLWITSTSVRISSAKYMTLPPSAGSKSRALGNIWGTSVPRRSGIESPKFRGSRMEGLGIEGLKD
jgi:hypothetical protein